MKFSPTIAACTLLLAASTLWQTARAGESGGVPVPIPESIAELNDSSAKSIESGHITASKNTRSVNNVTLNNFATNSDFFGASARRITLNKQLMPAGSFYTPNSFVNNSNSRLYTFLHGLSRVRGVRNEPGCEPDCSDAIVYAELDVWKRVTQSFTLQYSLHSLTGRNGGTEPGEGQSIGFKYARMLSENSAFSFSGEHIVQLDETVDLGRNYFFGYSRFVRSGLGKDKPGLGFLFNVGLGTGLYTVYDNVLFTTSSVLTGPYFSGDRPHFTGSDDELRWGLIGSISYYFSDRIALGAEFIGYGLGIGMSVKPFRKIPLTATGYLYDVVDDFPDGIPCAEDPCQPRLYGRVTYSF